MSMLSAQVDELRDRAATLRMLSDSMGAPYIVPETKRTIELAMWDAAKRMEEAADTIENLRDSLNEVADKWAGEMIIAEDYARENMMLKANNGSRWFELFGTPEKAARILECSCHLLYGLKVDGFVSCIGCPVYDKKADIDDCCYDELLKWLKGESNGK